MSDFHRRSGASWDGPVQAYCKDCARKKTKAWRDGNRERARELWREAERRRRADPERLADRREQQRQAKRRERAT
jgi:hypothetical protein